jgi:hypothetical protein
MGLKPSKSLAHPYEADPAPILNARPPLWWLPELERCAIEEAQAIQYGGLGIRPRRSKESRDR